MEKVEQIVFFTLRLDTFNNLYAPLRIWRISGVFITLDAIEWWMRGNSEAFL